MIAVGSCNGDVTSTIVQTIMEKNEQELKDSYARWLPLGLGLNHLGTEWLKLEFMTIFIFWCWTQSHGSQMKNISIAAVPLMWNEAAKCMLLFCSQVKERRLKQHWLLCKLSLNLSAALPIHLWTSVHMQVSTFIYLFVTSEHWYVWIFFNGFLPICWVLPLLESVEIFCFTSTSWGADQ